MSEGYEYSAAVTVMLPTCTDVEIDSPWANEPCEVAIIAVSFGDAGGLMLSPEQRAPVPAVGSSTLQAGGTASAGMIRGLGVFASAAGVVAVNEIFHAMPRGRLFASATIGNAHSATVSLVFRRSIALYPQLPAVPVMSGEHIDERAIDAYHAARARAVADAAGQPGPRTR